MAIQDLSSAGNQPLVSADNRYVAVFNGEIYNFRELQARFHLQTTSASDAAVIMPLWMLLGTRCLSLLEGMWALAIVDQELQTVTLARDCFGIKPLFVRMFQDGSVAFASELRALAHLDPPADMDPQSFVDFLQFGAMGPLTSPYRGVQALPPNSWMQLPLPAASERTLPSTSGEVVAGEHPFTEPAPDGSPWEALLVSVDMHLRADVPTSLLLSAGLDSSLLACAAERRGHSLDCFTVKLQGQEDESTEAAVTARHFGHHHHVVEAAVELNDLEMFFRNMQRPSIDGLNTFLVCKAIHAHGYRVALSGLGGDEAIAGYPHMRYFPLLRLARMTDQLGMSDPMSRLFRKPKLASLVHSSGPRGAKSFDELFRQVFDRHSIDRLLARGSAVDLELPSKDLGLRSLIEEEVVNYLQRTLLPDADAFSMCWTVELRVPFLDLRYFRAAAGFAKPLRGKSRLAAMAGDDRINVLRRRKKQGFTLPMLNWMRDGLLGMLIAETRQANAPIWDFLDRKAAQLEMARLSPQQWVLPWTLAVFDQWLRSEGRQRVSSVSYE